jgi:anthranilate phosphoribosyltransferase
MARPSPTPAARDPLLGALTALAHGERLGEERVADAVAILVRGDAPPEQAAAFLMGLRVQGEEGAEIAGAARALRAAMRPVSVADAPPVVDTAGTGGGRVGTFNVSTAAAFVAAGAGVRVAKHGNRSYTSRCGSADVLEALGIDLARQADHAGRVLQDVGMVFLFAPAFHPAMRFVAPVRRSIAVPTVMNLVGPLVNPAGVRRQVVGVADLSRAPVIADALRRLGTTHALVVHADVGMDEISPQGTTRVWEVRGNDVRPWTMDAADFGVRCDDLSALAGGEPAANAARIEALLRSPAGDPAGRDATVLNAAAALYVAGAAGTFGTGMAQASAALADGRAWRVLEALRRSAPVSSGG